MAESTANELIQEVADARVDMQSLSVFVNADAATQVPRRLADPIETLAYWRDYMAALTKGADGTNGTDGISATMTMTASTGAAGTEVSLVTGGTPTARTFALTIPRGDKGIDGSFSQKAYTTYAAMDADKVNIPANTSVTVTNDTDTTKNGMYAYSGTVFTKSVYDPLTLAKVDATTKANTAKSEAITAAATDATTKADSAKTQANQYTDSAVGALDLTVDTGKNIHYRAKDAPTKKFSAIWNEYSKPVWHIGNGVLVDTTGATLKLLKEELVFTIKLTAANQTFLYPIRNAPDPAINATVNWGDGITTTHTDQNINHTYVGAIGDVFTIRVSGNPLHFDFSASNAARNTSKLMMRSIESNTLPKTMPYFSLLGCTNMIYLGRGALSSFTGTSLAGYFLDLNSLVIDSKVFEGLGQVTNINNLFGDASKPVAIAIPANVLDVFTNATTAMGIFRGLSAPLPLGILDKLTSLQNVSNMFFSATVTSIDSNLFKYQTGLQDVSNTFRLASSAIANAQTLYNDMVRGNPTSTALCFNGANSMTNLAQVPSTWK